MVWYPIKAYQTINEQSGERLKYELTTHEFVPNAKVDENTFRFDFPKGTEVFDRIRNIYGVDLPKEPPSLVGKALPPLEDLNIKLDADQVKDKTILICFWDMQQRPSRNCIMQLRKRAQELKKKEVVVIAVHASKIEQETLDDWIKENDINMTFGLSAGDEKKIRFNWGVKSLPWLILTDSKHIVIAEGFGLDKLDEKIRLTDDGK
jgi:hypothetical protein